MREDEACRFIETQQTLLVAKNEVVVRCFFRHVRTALSFGFDHLPFLVNREITAMNLLRREPTEICIVRFVTQMGRFIRCNPRIFFLEYLLKDTFFGIAVAIVAAILRNLVDKEKGKALDTFLEKLTLLLKVGLDSLADLNALHVQFVRVAYEVAFAECYSVGEGDVGGWLSI